MVNGPIRLRIGMNATHNALANASRANATIGRSVRLIGGVIVLLVLAAFIEAYWSSMTFAEPSVKYAVGAALWLLVLSYLLLAGRGAHAPD